jgi:hypothetical protein
MVMVYPSGQRVDAIVLAAGNGRMRVAMRDHTDAVELRMVDGQWMDEQGLVEVEAITTDARNGANQFFGELLPRTRGAAG